MTRIGFAVLITLFSVSVPASSFAATLTKEELQTGDSVTDNVQKWISCVESADSYEAAQAYFTDDSDQDSVNEIYDSIKNAGTLNELNAIYLDDVNGTDMVLFEYYLNASDTLSRNLYLFEQSDDGSYKACFNEDLMDDASDLLNQKFLCPNCGGNGSIEISAGSTGTVCAICGGTGQQYIPNLYYDTVMGWTGGYIGCSGCGGSGYIGSAAPTYATCETCMGRGIVW